MSQAGTRRSARLSSVPKSVGAQSVVTATPGTSATPGRRRGALAKVKARQSTAYGASGRLGAAEELSVPATGFASAFESQRGAAVGRVEESVVTGPMVNGGSSPPGSPDQSGKATSPSIRDDESEDPPSDDEQEEDSGNTSKSFGMMREAGMLRTPNPVVNRLAASVKSTVVRPAPRQPEAATSARPIRLLVRPPVPMAAGPQKAPVAAAPKVAPAAAPKVAPAAAPEATPAATTQGPRSSGWKQYWLLVAIAIMSLLGCLALAKAPVVKYRVASGLTSLADWIAPTASEGHQGRLWTRLNKQGSDLKALQDDLHQIRAQLPNELAATANEDGSWTMSEGFWKAVVGRLQKDGPDPNWDRFLRENEANVQKLYEDGISWQKNEGVVILRDELYKAINASWSNLATDFDKKFAELSRSAAKEATQVASREAKKISIDASRQNSRVLASLLTNIELNWNKVNYFSTGLGAQIDSALTSSTFVDSSAFIARLARRVMLFPQRRPPTTALESWAEPGDCWCSAPDDNKMGKAQLGIKLYTPTYPTQVTIEHIPKAAVPQENISSAPRDLEVWVKSYEPAKSRFGLDLPACGDGPDGWICLGKVRYDIHGSNHVQTFLLDAESRTPVDNVMVRVTKNWGAQHTCLYRVQLHGKDTLPKHEYMLQD